MRINIGFICFCCFHLSRLSAQASCDTILTADGRRISVEVRDANGEGIFYFKCPDTTGVLYFLPHKDRAGFSSRAVKSEMPPTNSKIRKTNKVEHQHKFILWAGTGLSDLASRYNAQVKPYVFSLGVEYRVPKESIHAGGLITQLFLDESGYNASSESGGFNLEYGLYLKKISYGRLSGRMSKGYYGGDVRFSSISQSFVTSTGNYERLERISSIMIRLGFQLNAGHLAFDFSVPIGLAFTSTEFQGPQTNYKDEVTQIAFRPGIMVGYSF